MPGELRARARGSCDERLGERAGLHRAERDAVGGHAVRADLGREPAHEAHRAGLGRAVDRLDALALAARVGDDRDDPPPPGVDHRADVRVRDVQHRAEVEAHRVFPVFGAGVDELLQLAEARRRDARVVHEDVDRTGLLAHARILSGLVTSAFTGSRVRRRRRGRPRPRPRGLRRCR